MQRQPLNEKQLLINDNHDISQGISNQILFYTESYQSFHENINQSWDKLPQDLIDEISSYVPYKQDIFKTEQTGEILSTGLIALRLASKNINCQVENTPAGQLARKAINLEPNFYNASFAINYYPCVMFTHSACNYPAHALGFIGGFVGGTFGCCKLGSLLPCNGVGVGLTIGGFIIGGCFGFATVNVSSHLCEHGLFRYAEEMNENRNEINEIRQRLHSILS